MPSEYQADRGAIPAASHLSLGWDFPAALGAAVARPDRPVVSLGSDGGFVMTAQELATAARYRPRLIALVHDDSADGAIKNIQQRRYAGRFLDVDLNNPDFLQLAAAFGVPAARSLDAEGLSRSLREALARQGPSLIEVPDRWRSHRE